MKVRGHTGQKQEHAKTKHLSNKHKMETNITAQKLWTKEGGGGQRSEVRGHISNKLANVKGLKLWSPAAVNASVL